MGSQHLSRRSALKLLASASLPFVVARPSGAAEKASPPGVRAIKDVPYGPDARHVMDLYLPEGISAPRPLIVCIHGGGWAGGDKRVYTWMGQAFAQRGFPAVSITYRFAPKFTAPAQMDDVQRAVRWLRKNAKQYSFDAERFGAIGGSAGGHLASYLALADTRDNSDRELASFSSRVQCAVDCYGPVDLVAMMRSESARIVQGFIGKPLEGNEEAYRSASPHYLVRKNPPPFLIAHGTRDDGSRMGSVPIEQSIEFEKKLREAGGEATLMKLEGAGHGFTGGGGNPYARQTFEAAVQFFTKHLGAPENRR